MRNIKLKYFSKINDQYYKLFGYIRRPHFPYIYYIIGIFIV